MLQLIFLRGELLLLALKKIFIILLCLLVSLNISSWLTSSIGTSGRSCLRLFSYILQDLFNHLFSLFLLCLWLALTICIQGLHDISLCLLKSLLSCIFLWLFTRCSFLIRFFIRIGNSRFTGLFGFFGLRILFIIDRHLLILLCILGWLFLRFSNLRSCCLCCSIILCLLFSILSGCIFALHHLGLLLILFRIRLQLR